MGDTYQFLKLYFQMSHSCTPNQEQASPCSIQPIKTFGVILLWHCTLAIIILSLKDQFMSFLCTTFLTNQTATRATTHILNAPMY